MAAALAGLLDPAPAVLEKDTLYGGFVGATLAAAGRPDSEREGPWYDEHVKAHEYAGMTAAARSIRSWVAELGGPAVHLVWVRIDPATLRHRLEIRGRTQDAGKLADFAAFVARMRPAEPPPVPHLAVEARENLVVTLRAAIRRPSASRSRTTG